MTCERHRIYDRMNKILRSLHEKYKAHRSLIQFNAVTEIKPYGVKVHVQIVDKKCRCIVFDTTIRLRNEKELSFAEDTVQNCDLALAIVLDELKNELPETGDCIIIDSD